MTMAARYSPSHFHWASEAQGHFGLTHYGGGGQDSSSERDSSLAQTKKYVHVLFSHRDKVGVPLASSKVCGRVQGTCLALSCSSFILPRNPSLWHSESEISIWKARRLLRSIGTN